ncbi:MAG TPA: SDR family NAD(P)-dependent oxidoreductase [Candidatus Acidoferrales bacterium]
MPKDSQPLRQEVAIVTGATRGIGRAIAAQLCRLGAQVVVCGRGAREVERAARELGASGQALGITADVQKLDDVERLVNQTMETFERIDILVNNAGIGMFGPVDRLAPEEWEQVVNTNLRGAFYTIRAVAPHMMRQGSGHIINISSLAGKNGFAGGTIYCASKFGLMGLSYSAAEDLRGYGIRVSVICPGSVHTEFSPHAGKNPEKMLKPEDVAHAVAMLVTQRPQSFISEIDLRPTQKP